MLLRLTLYATLGLVLDAVGQDWNTWGFWSILALFVCVEHVTRAELIEQIQKEVVEYRKRHPELDTKDNNNDQR